jgi:hypothetical protein
MTAWLVAFLFTQVVEVPVWMRAFDRRPWLAFMASALTHPVVWFVLPRFGMPYPAYLIVAVAYAVGLEEVWAWRFGVRRPLVWSLVANGASFGLGLLFRWAVRVGRRAGTRGLCSPGRERGASRGVGARWEAGCARRPMRPPARRRASIGRGAVPVTGWRGGGGGRMLAGMGVSSSQPAELVVEPRCAAQLVGRRRFVDLTDSLVRRIGTWRLLRVMGNNLRGIIGAP